MRVYTKDQPPQGGMPDCDSHAPLDNYAKKGAKSDTERQKSRSQRYQARELLWQVSKLSRVRSCGRVGVRLGGSVGVRALAGADGRLIAGFAGLATCGSVWACPVCAAKIQARRREEVSACIKIMYELGFQAIFTTITLAHRKTMPLAQTWNALRSAVSATRQHGSVRRLRGNLRADLSEHDPNLFSPTSQAMPMIRAQEVTYGANGWHPHQHVLGFIAADVTDDDIKHLADLEFRVYSEKIKAMGLPAPMREFYQVKRVHTADQAMADYMSKQSDFSFAESAAFEIASSTTKKGRKKGQTPFQVFESFRRTGNMDYLDLWNEFEQVSKGKHALDWSRGLKQFCGIGDTSDEDIAAQEIGSKDDECFVIADWWRDVVAPGDGGRVAAGLLSCIETAGVAAGRDYCADYGIEIMEPHAAAARAAREHRARLGARSTAADDADVYVMADRMGHALETRIMSLAREWRGEIIEQLTRDNLEFFDETEAWRVALDEWHAHLYQGHRLPSDVLKAHPPTELDTELRAYHHLTGVAFNLSRALQVDND